MKTSTNKTFKQPLFDTLYELGIIAIQSEMDELIRVCKKIEQEKSIKNNFKTTKKKKKMETKKNLTQAEKNQIKKETEKEILIEIIIRRESIIEDFEFAKQLLYDKKYHLIPTQFKEVIKSTEKILSKIAELKENLYL